MSATNTMQKISLFSLAMLITGAIDSIRNLPASALFGAEILFFFALAAICFLLPTALISAELSASLPAEGGIYQWTKHAMGKNLGFVAVWLQWINTMVWYPTILSFIAGTATYSINPNWVHNKHHMVLLIVIIFWALTLLNLRGLKISTRFASWCAIGGMIIPMIAIILLAAGWLLSGHASAVHFSSQSMLPSLSKGNSWISLTAIITAFLGMELATVHSGQVDHAKALFPKAIGIAVVIITLTMILGSLAIACVIPTDKIELVSGVVQSFTLFFNAYHLHWMIPVIAIMLVIGSLGGMINWMISPAKGLQHASRDGYFSAWFIQENKHQVPSRILLIQACLVTVICCAFYLMPSVNGSYWLLTDLSTEVYMLMYILMFIAAMIIKQASAKDNNQIIPGKRGSIWLISILGLIGCFCTCVVGFIPPDSIDVGSHAHYQQIFSLGLLLMLLPAFIIIAWRKHWRKKP